VKASTSILDRWGIATNSSILSFIFRARKQARHPRRGTADAGTLRGIARLIDAGRRRGRTSGRFLLLGSASVELLRQSETLAGRIAYIEMSPLDVLETPDGRQTDLWVRGGFPEVSCQRFIAQPDLETVVYQNVSGT